MSYLNSVLIFLNSILITVIGGLIFWRLREWLSNKINPDIRFEKAPRNILKHITPGVTVEKVKELLGAPYYDDQGRLIYKFKHLNIEFKVESDRITTIILLLKNFGFRRKYPIHPTKYTLGKTTLGDVIHNQENLGVEVASKHGKVWIERYFGNPGYYWNYTFGIFDGPSAQYPHDFPEFSTSEQRIFGDYDDLKVNFIAVSNKENNGATFDFFAMR